MNAWPIYPCIGLGPLRFGMSRQEVAGLPGAGPVGRAVENHDGSISESRGLSWPVCIFIDDRLTSIDTTRRLEGVAFAGLPVYQAAAEAVLSALLAAERDAGGQDATLLDDTLHFLALGIACTGFWLPEVARPFRPGQDEDLRGLALSPPGAFAPWVDRMVPVDLAIP